MIDVFTQVTMLKESAKANRDFDDYKSAIEDLEQAVKVLKREESIIQDEGRKDSLRSELADCYGMIGGNYRRLAIVNGTNSKSYRSYLEKALDNYEEGAKFERDESYNLSNLIVITILLDPAQLVYKQPKIVEYLSKIQKQIMGERRDQWWAWADLGLFKLLAGDKKGALEAYYQFKQKGARETDYESTINVLSDLQKQLQSIDFSQATTIAQSIGEAIQFLKKSAISSIAF